MGNTRHVFVEMLWRERKLSKKAQKYHQISMYAIILHQPRKLKAVCLCFPKW
jgi:hypothetical protein